MKPIGLTIKNIKTNPFTGKSTGELMIVHLCLGCGRISCNRIAGDDNPYAILSLVDEVNKLSNEIIFELNKLDIRLLNKDNKQEVLTILYGHKNF